LPFGNAEMSDTEESTKVTNLTGASPRAGGVRSQATWAMAAAGRHFPLMRGHSRIAGLIPAAGSGAEPSVEVRLRSGPRILIHPDEHIGRTIFFFGDLSPRLSWVCSRVLGPGDTVVDVGANYGVVTLLAAAAVGPTGRLHAFEPQPGIAALLRRSIGLNGMSQVEVHEVALSDRDGEMDLYVPDENLGAGSLSRILDEPGATFQVQVRTSGPFLEALALGPVKLLKIDIEGHEPEFLRGARDFLAASPPDVIIMESNDHIFGPSKGPISLWDRPAIQELCQLGYEITAIDRMLRNLFVAGLTRLQPGRDDDWGHSLDYVAIHSTCYRQMATLLRIKEIRTIR
jgi:FkbM family methyltransferase